MLGYFVYLQSDNFKPLDSEQTIVEKNANTQLSQLYQNVQDTFDKIMNSENIPAIYKRRAHGAQTIFMKELKNDCQDYSPCVVDKLKVRDIELNNYYQRHRTK
jgi:hypothetical protein